jgi:hypothetical protein
MSAIKRITANLPEELLRSATEVTQEGITETLIRGLELVKRSRAYQKAKNLKGIDLSSIDLEMSRERNRR